MPTPNGLWLPTEVNDEALKEVGIEGYIDPTTGLMLPYSEEAQKIILERTSSELKELGRKVEALQRKKKKK